MDALKLDAFLRIVEGQLVENGIGRDDTVVRHVATHSNRMRSGSAFFALRGSRADGHAFASAAARNGAVLAVVEPGRVDPATVDGMPLVAVADPLRALQDLAAWWRRRIDARVIAVAGSIGKTTAKDCLVHVLGQDRCVYGTPGSYNIQLGVPLAILECPRTAEIAVVEVAVSDPGEMTRLAQIVDPDDLVLTNVGTRWRYRFADRGQQIGELLSLASKIDANGWLLLGQDDPELWAAAASLRCRRITQGASPELPRFGDPVRDPATTMFEVAFPGREQASVSILTPSDALVADVQLAISAAWLAGVDASLILDAVLDYKPISTRLEIWRSPSGVTLMRDVATPDPMAVSSAVRTAKRLTRPGGRMAIVLAEPAASWDVDAAAGLAEVLVDEHADVVFGLSPSHERTGSLIARLGQAPPVRLFASTDELRRHLVDNLGSGDVCLVQAEPERPIEDLSRSLMEAMAPTRLYVDLSAIEDNVTTFHRIVGPSVRLMAMVKALAYGTEAVSLGLCLQEAGVDCLGVATADEGITLRQAGIGLPILVFIGTSSEIDKMVRHRLTPVVSSPEMLEAVASLPPQTSAPFGVHVEVDTGMHRAGFAPAEVFDVLRRLAGTDGVRVDGLMTHLACADDPTQDAFTRMQLDRFASVLDAAGQVTSAVIRHVGATAAAIRFPDARYDMVRIGLGLHGLHPSDATAKVELTPVMGLVSRIIQIIELAPGERVGYGGTYTTPQGGGRVGVVPAGYHDCVPRALSNYGYVMVAGVRCSIIGTISMDSMTVDLTGCPEAAVGSDVLIYGRQGDSIVPLEDVSATIGTIPYEVMARVGPRVQRVFTRH